MRNCLLLLVLLSSPSLVMAAESPCTSADEVQFIYGMLGPEGLVQVPGTLRSSTRVPPVGTQSWLGAFSGDHVAIGKLSTDVRSGSSP